MAEEEPRRTVVFFGRTGSGKSSAANAIAGATDKFKESEFSVSETKGVKSQVFDLWCEASRKRCKVTIVDTVGFGDTDLPLEEVLTQLAEVCHDCRDGINAVYFVTSGRFTEEEAVAFDLLWQVLFGSEILSYTTIVRSHFSEFKDPFLVDKDKEKLRKQRGPASRIWEQIRNPSLYIDVPTPKYDEGLAIRKDSGAILLNHLMIKCSNSFQPPILRKVKEHISKHVERLRKLEDIDERNRELQEIVRKMQKLLEEQGPAERFMGKIGSFVDKGASWVKDKMTSCSLM